MKLTDKPKEKRRGLSPKSGLVTKVKSTLSDLLDIENMGRV